MTQWGLDTLFNPAKRHMDEEKQRLQSTREEIGDSSGGKRIDLESGKVTISRAQPRSGPGSDDAEADADGPGSDGAEADAAETAKADAAETDAAETANPKTAKVAEPDADAPDGIAAGTAVQGPEGTNKSDPA